MLKRNSVCLFFYVQGKFLIHGCSLEEAENYGDFLIYPDSHFEIWEKHYEEQYDVDFDFFPRGRVAYYKTEKKFWLYYDTCIGEDIQIMIDAYYNGKVELVYDEHYQCHQCNLNYSL